MKISAPHLIDALFQEYPEGSQRPASTQEPGEELTRTVLSAETSRTGHDFPHLGPVQLAVSLYLAGFRGVELYEMEDPFVFSVPEESPETARHVAFTYLQGMYGMTESFGGQPDRFGELIHEILSYPEIGNEPLLGEGGEDLVYVPRRAVVVSARRPEDGPWAPLGETDTALVRVLTGLLDGGGPESLQRWGVTPDTQRQWLSWVSYGPVAGRRQSY